MKKLLILLFFIPSLVFGQEIALRDAKQDNVDTYRIPGISTSVKGTLLAIWDNRIDNSRDLQGDIDIGMCRSKDGGRSWLPLQTVLDMGTWGGLPQKFNGVSDASILVDENSGRIWVAGLWMHGVLDKDGKWIKGLTKDSQNWQHQWRARGSQSGLSPYETSQFLLAYSDDDGDSWSDPINITSSVKRRQWWLAAPAPGRGITLTDGTLVFPSQGRDSVGETFSNIIYSKDGGKTWSSSNAASTNTTECAVVQLNDGSLMLNMRDNRNAKDKSNTNGRAVF
ncbi:MAG: sialidase family protein, partial [Rikenellaceae bacterium]